MGEQPPGPTATQAGSAPPTARESTDYLAGFSDGYRAACAAHGVFDDAITALADQKPWQALDTATARRNAATTARGPERTPAQLRADAYASWGLTDHHTTRAERVDLEENGS